MKSASRLAIYLILLSWIIIPVVVSIEQDLSINLLFFVITLLCIAITVRYFTFKTGVGLFILGLVLYISHFIGPAEIPLNCQGQYCIPPMVAGLLAISYFIISSYFKVDLELDIQHFINTLDTNNCDSQSSLTNLFNWGTKKEFLTSIIRILLIASAIAPLLTISYSKMFVLFILFPFYFLPSLFAFFYIQPRLSGICLILLGVVLWLALSFSSYKIGLTTYTLLSVIPVITGLLTIIYYRYNIQEENC